MKEDNKKKGDPQLENGYTKIADEFLEWLCQCPLLKDSTRIILAIIRLTWGFNEKKAKIRNIKISEITGIDRHRVSRKMKRLKERNVVQNDNKTGKIGINKHYNEWVLHKSTTKKVAQKYNKKLHKSTTYVAQKYNTLDIYTNTYYKHYKEYICHKFQSKEKIGENLGRYFKKLLQREPIKSKISALLKENDCKTIAIAITRFSNYHRKIKAEGWEKKRGKEFSKFFEVFEQLKTKSGYEEFLKETAGWNKSKSKQSKQDHLTIGAPVSEDTPEVDSDLERWQKLNDPEGYFMQRHREADKSKEHYGFDYPTCKKYLSMLKEWEELSKKYGGKQ